MVKEVIASVGEEHKAWNMKGYLNAEQSVITFFLISCRYFCAFVLNSMNWSSLLLGQVILKVTPLTLLICLHINSCFLVLMAKDVFTVEKKDF